MRKIFLLMAAALVSVAMTAATVTDLKPIVRNWTFIADDVTASGSTKLDANTLYAGDLIFTPTGNSVANNKGQSTINGQAYYNSLRIKLVQDRLAFKVNDACTVTFYTQSHSSRGLLVSNIDNNQDEAVALAKEPVSTTVWTVDLPSAGTYYLTSYGGDFFFAGFSVEFEGGGEAVTEYYVKYVNTNGVIIGYDTLPVANPVLSYKYGVDDVIVPAGQAFRGWFNSAAYGASKVPEGTVLDNDMHLYAQATDIEVATEGSFYIYDLSKPFYQEDHECITITGAEFNSKDKGWKCEENAVVSLTIDALAYVSINGGEALPYSGPTTINLSFAEGSIIKSIAVYNVAQMIAKDEATGYYILTANDGASLYYLLSLVQDGDKIFLPNGTYDFNKQVLTHISKSISLIGQSMDGVLIVNHPLVAGMNGAETLFIETGAENVYMQDLGIRCDVFYPESKVDGVGIALQVRGDKSILKRVSLQGNQDTYLSAGNPDQRGWIEDGRIEGTVDYICGGGDIWFENITFHNNLRSTPDVIFAPATESGTVYGYVVNNSTIEGAHDGQYQLARGWKNNAAVTWLNTTCKVVPSAKGYKEMNALTVRFHEFNTHKVDGTVITGHNLDGLNYSAQSDPIYMTNDSIYTYANVILGSDNWDARAIAADAVADPKAIDAEAIYLVEKDGAFVALYTGAELLTAVLEEGATIRKANARGGFGQPVEAGELVEAIENTAAAVKVQKIIRNGQVVIVRDNKMFTILGNELAQ